jgi:hypothetical protein
MAAKKALFYMRYERTLRKSEISQVFRDLPDNNPASGRSNLWAKFVKFPVDSTVVAGQTVESSNRH